MAPTDSIYATTHYRVTLQIGEIYHYSEDDDDNDDADGVEEIDTSLGNIEEIHESDTSLESIEDEDGFVEFLLCTEVMDETPSSSLQTCGIKLFARRRLFSSDEDGDSEED